MNKIRKQKIISLLIFFGVFVGLVYFAIASASIQMDIDTTEEVAEVAGDQQMKQYEEAPEMALEENIDYKAVIKTSKGDIKIDLFEDDAPNTVNNFVFLAKEGFYNDVPFHRVIEDFMLQTGDPTGTGTGGPGYSFDDEINDIKLVEGSVAMANSGPNTNGSQFFIVTTEETPWLDGVHTNFGEVIEGMEIANEIESVETDTNDKPLEEIKINSVEIIEEPKS